MTEPRLENDGERATQGEENRTKTMVQNHGTKTTPGQHLPSKYERYRIVIAFISPERRNELEPMGGFTLGGLTVTPI
jgi:hypothetical protein